MPIYSGPSIVDFLKSIGQDSSRAFRNQLALQYGITNYTGTAAQNTQLLNNLRNSYTSTGSIFPATPTPPTPPATPTPPTPPATPATPTPPTPPGGWSSDPYEFSLQMANLPPTPDITTPPTGMSFQESDAYKSLSAEEKEIADLLFNVISVGGQAEATTFANAIQQAMAIAEPWVQAQMALALAEFAGNVDETIFNFAAKAEAIKRARDILAEDISSAKEFLTLEQQADMANQVRAYDEDLLNIADQAAEKGITFATGARSRALAESRRGEQFQDVVQSSRRQFNFRIKELELKAARGDVEAQKQLEILRSQESFALHDIGQAAEQVLGSTGVPTIPGFTPVGGVTGTIQETAQQHIISDVGGIVGLTDLLTP